MEIAQIQQLKREIETAKIRVEEFKQLKKNQENKERNPAIIMELSFRLESLHFLQKELSKLEQKRRDQDNARCYKKWIKTLKQ